MSRARTVALGLVVAGLGLACSTPASEGAGATTGGSAPATTLAAGGDEGAALALSAPAGPSVRDGDTTDVDELAVAMMADAAGDREWLEIFARLRAQSWLINRYPGRYDVTDTYDERWAAETATPTEAEQLELGVYLDEPLPRLISVDWTRELGELAELEVVIESQPALVRSLADDSVTGQLPGGRRRGLFTIGRTGPDGRWRIHSVVELRPPDGPRAEETNS